MERREKIGQNHFQTFIDTYYCLPGVNPEKLRVCRQRAVSDLQDRMDSHLNSGTFQSYSAVIIGSYSLGGIPKDYLWDSVDSDIDYLLFYGGENEPNIVEFMCTWEKKYEVMRAYPNDCSKIQHDLTPACITAVLFTPDDLILGDLEFIRSLRSHLVTNLSKDQFMEVEKSAKKTIVEWERLQTTIGDIESGVSRTQRIRRVMMNNPQEARQLSELLENGVKVPSLAEVKLALQMTDYKVEAYRQSTQRRGFMSLFRR